MKVLIALTIMLTCMLIGQPAKAYFDDRLVQSLCEYTKANDRSRIRKRLKQARLKFRKVYPTIQCEGMSMLDYAIANNAEDVIKFIETQISSDD